MVSSIIPYAAAEEEKEEEEEVEQKEALGLTHTKPTADQATWLTRRTQGESYKANLDAADDYAPMFLGDRSIKSGKHRIVLSLPGFMESVVFFVKQEDLKRELNDKFRLKHEWLTDSSVTLSNIRRIRRAYLSVAWELSELYLKQVANGGQASVIFFELSTLALANIYLEKMIAKGAINKENRKLTAGVLLVLAFKFNQGNMWIEYKNTLHLLFDLLEQQLSIKRQDLLAFEFGVYINLDFALNVATEQFAPSFTLCLYDGEVNIIELDCWADHPWRLEFVDLETVAEVSVVHSTSKQHEMEDPNNFNNF